MIQLALLIVFRRRKGWVPAPWTPELAFALDVLIVGAVLWWVT